MQEITLELALLGLLNRLLGVLRPVECKEGTCKIEITSYVRFQTLALLVLTQSLLVLPKLGVYVPQVAGRYRILLGPKLIRLRGLLQFARD